MQSALDKAFQVFNDIARASQDQASWGKDPWTRASLSKYPYIPLPWQSFQNLIQPLLRDNMRVVDVGCGAGDKLLMFRLLNPTLQITGIEYSDTLAACAEYICAPYATIIRGDALAQNYKHYDLIYMYRPMVDPDGQAALQARVMMQMRVGAHLRVVYPQWQDPMTGYEFPDLYRGWTKPRRRTCAIRMTAVPVENCALTV